jgi:O-antigen/teichoic acid export membrane protein
MEDQEIHSSIVNDHSSSRTSRAAKGTITSFIQFALQIVTQAAVAPLVLRIAGQETLGAYGVLMQAIAYLALVDLGFGVALGRFLSQAYGLTDERKTFRQIVATSRAYFLCSNILFAVLVLIFASRVGGFFSFTPSVASNARIGLYLVAAWSVIRTPVAFYGSALLATQNLAAANSISALGNVMRAVFSVGLVAAGAGLVGLMMANILAEALTFWSQAWYYKKCYPEDYFGWGFPDRKLFRHMFGFSGAYFLVNIANRLTFGTDNLLVGAMFGVIYASVYYTTQMPTLLLVALVWRLADNAAPAMNELYARQSFDQLKVAYLRLLRYSLLMGLGLALGILSFNKPLISLWVGARQYGGGLMTVALAIFSVGQIADHLNATVMVVLGRLKWLSIFTISGGLIKLALALSLRRIVGPPSVMVASALVEIPLTLCMSAYSLSLLGISYEVVLRKVVGRTVWACAFCIPAVVACYVVKPAIRWGEAGAWVALFMASWVIGVFVVGLVPAEVTQLSSYLLTKVPFRRT